MFAQAGVFDVDLERIEDLLRRLRLPRIRNVFRERLDQALKEELNLATLLGGLLEDEVTSREESQLRSRLRRADFPYSRTIEQLRAPLTDRVHYYLQRVFPGAELKFDDSLVPEGLLRGADAGELAALSVGTQEQVGLIARLAYADLLQAAGRPTLLILDDAVTHTDSVRREAVKRLLLEAATRHQLLLFTCHPEAWDDLGVPMRPVDELKPGTTAQ